MQLPRARFCSTTALVVLIAASAVHFLADRAHAQDDNRRIIRRDIEVFTDFCDCPGDLGDTCTLEDVLEADEDLDCLPDIDLRTIDFNNGGEQIFFSCPRNTNNCTWTNIPLDVDVVTFRIRFDENDEDQDDNTNDDLTEFVISNGETIVETNVRGVGATVVATVVVIYEGDEEEPTTPEEPPTPEETTTQPPRTTRTRVTPITEGPPITEEPVAEVPGATPPPDATPDRGVDAGQEADVAEGPAAGVGDGGISVAVIAGVAAGVAVCLACCIFLLVKRFGKSRRKKHDPPTYSGSAPPAAKKVEVSIVGTPLSPSNRSSNTSINSSSPLHNKMDSMDSTQSAMSTTHSFRSAMSTTRSVEGRPSGRASGEYYDDMAPAAKSALRGPNSPSPKSRKVLFKKRTSEHEVVIKALQANRITHECMQKIWSESLSLQLSAPEQRCRELYGEVLHESKRRIFVLLDTFKQIDKKIVAAFYEESHGAPLEKTVSAMDKIQPGAPQYRFDTFEKAADKVLIPHVERGLSRLIVQSTDTNTRLV